MKKEDSSKSLSSEDSSAAERGGGGVNFVEPLPPTAPKRKRSLSNLTQIPNGQDSPRPVLKKARGRPPLSSKGRSKDSASADKEAHRRSLNNDAMCGESVHNYYYTAMPITPSHQQTARTRLSSSVRISTHQIIAALMTREPQSISQLHEMLAQLHSEHDSEVASLISNRRNSYSAVEQASRSTTPSVLLTEQQIVAILDVLQIMGLIVCVARRKTDKTIDTALKEDGNSNKVNCTKSSPNRLESQKEKETKSTATKLLTDYDSCNHFETARYTMVGCVKGPTPLGGGGSDTCAPARAELGKLPIFNNLHIDTEARLRNTEMTKTRISELKDLLSKLRSPKSEQDSSSLTNSSLDNFKDGTDVEIHVHDNSQATSVKPDSDNANTAAENRTIFSEYVKKTIDSTKRPLDFEAADLGLQPDQDLLYRTIALELQLHEKL